MRFLAPALLFVPLMSFGTTQFETHKALDGGVQYCNSAEDLGKGGAMLENTNVVESAKSAGSLDLSLVPNFYRCAKTATGYAWVPSNVTQFLSRSVKTDAGIVHIVPTYSKWVVYAQNYVELNPDPNVKSANSPNTYTVRIEDLLGGDQKDNHNKGQTSRGIVTVFLKYITKAVYPNGKEDNFGIQATGAFNIVITLPSH